MRKTSILFVLTFLSLSVLLTSCATGSGNAVKVKSSQKKKAHSETNLNNEETEKGDVEIVEYPKAPDVQLSNILSSMTSSPQSASSADAYIHEHPEEYYELLKLVKESPMEIEEEYKRYEGSLEGKLIEKAREEIKENDLFLYVIAHGIIVKTDGSEKRELSEKEVKDVTRAFTVMKYCPHRNETIVNPISHLLMSSYDKPENIDISATIRYMGNTVLKDDKEDAEKLGEKYKDFADSAKFEELKKFENFPFKDAEKLSDVPVPIKEVFFEDVDDLLFNYMGTSLDELSGVGMEEAFYIEKYGSFFNYTSDFGMADFIANSGTIDGDTLTLYSDYATLVLKKARDMDRWYIISHMSNSREE